MAKLIVVNNPEYEDCRIGCYSERGCFSYLFFRYLPQKENFRKFLHSINFPISNNELESVGNYTLFSELDLGKFGSPDGGFLFVIGEQRYFVFVEGKFNESYNKSCSSSNYASSIRGQIELKYRMIYAVLQRQKIDKNSELIIESQVIADLYKNRDDFYSKEAITKRSKTAEGRRLKLVKKKNINDAEREKILSNINDLNKNYRRLKLIDGVKDLFNELSIENLKIYYLIITNDKINPLEKTENKDYLPSMYNEEGVSQTHENLLWINAEFIEGLIKGHSKESKH